jgi:hypothetical protein
MSFPLPIDRGVSRFLSTIDFITLRRTSLTHYNDKEAWRIYCRKMPLNFPGLSDRKKVGLHYLLGWALKFPAPCGSHDWFQMIVNWLTFKSSIKIIYTFLFHFSREFLLDLDIGHMTARQRFIWLRLYHRNSRVFKRQTLEYDYNERPRKIARRDDRMYRDILTRC